MTSCDVWIPEMSFTGYNVEKKKENNFRNKLRNLLREETTKMFIVYVRIVQSFLIYKCIKTQTAAASSSPDTAVENI